MTAWAGSGWPTRFFLYTAGAPRPHELRARDTGSFFVSVRSHFLSAHPVQLRAIPVAGAPQWAKRARRASRCAVPHAPAGSSGLGNRSRAGISVVGIAELHGSPSPGNTGGALALHELRPDSAPLSA